MKCICGHEENKHQEMNDELACMVILNSDDGSNNYCQCVKYEVDKNAKLTALREAGEKMVLALQSVLHDRPSAHTDNVWEGVNAALEAWEAANQ